MINKFYHSQLKQSMQTQNNTLATQIDSVFEDMSTCAFKLMQDLNDPKMKSYLLTKSSDDVLFNHTKSKAMKPRSSTPV